MKSLPSAHRPTRSARHRSLRGTVPWLEVPPSIVDLELPKRLFAADERARWRAMRDRFAWTHLEGRLDAPVPMNPRVAARLVDLRAEVAASLGHTDFVQWYMHKPPGLRIRIGAPAPAPGLLGTAAALGFRPASRAYEPEFALFGHGASLQLTHALFDLDATLITNFVAANNGPRRTAPWLLSLLVAAIVMDALEIVGWEDRSVWENVWSLGQRSAIGDAVPIDESAPVIRETWGLIRGVGSGAIPALAKDDALVEPLCAYQARVASEVRAAEAAGAFADPLAPGVREFLAYMLIFLWNRLAVGPAVQAAIAKALMRTAR